MQETKTVNGNPSPVPARAPGNREAAKYNFESDKDIKECPYPGHTCTSRKGYLCQNPRPCKVAPVIDSESLQTKIRTIRRLQAEVDTALGCERDYRAALLREPCAAVIMRRRA